MKIWQLLGYLGLLPFIIFLWFFDNVTSYISVTPQQGFIFYSAIILSFLAGSLWQKHNSARAVKLQIISNAFCLYAFACLFTSINIALLLLPLGYLILMQVEYLLCHNHHPSSSPEKDIPAHYFMMRFILTITVSIFHGIAYTLWF
jgi:hypothetical protein